MINEVRLIGRLGKDPEMKHIPNGSALGTFSIATSNRWKDKQSGEWKESTTWANVVTWNMEWIGDKLHKGDVVYVSGRLETRSYDKNGEKRYSTEVIADKVLNLSAIVKGKEESPDQGPDPWS